VILAVLSAIAGQCFHEPESAIRAQHEPHLPPVSLPYLACSCSGRAGVYTGRHKTPPKPRLSGSARVSGPDSAHACTVHAEMGRCQYNPRACVCAESVWVPWVRRRVFAALRKAPALRAATTSMSTARSLGCARDDTSRPSPHGGGRRANEWLEEHWRASRQWHPAGWPRNPLAPPGPGGRIPRRRGRPGAGGGQPRRAKRRCGSRRGGYGDPPRREWRSWPRQAALGEQAGAGNRGGTA